MQRSPSKIVPSGFFFDHVHYSRWIPIHLRDVVSLAQLNPDVYYFWRKSSRQKVKMFILYCFFWPDPWVAQCLRYRGAAGALTENPAALRRWMVSGARDDLFNSESLVINRVEAGHRCASSYTEETHTNDICARFAITEPSHGRYREPVHWLKQWYPCPGLSGHIKGRHSAADEER